MIVYLCGPINGCTDEECKDWREYAKSALVCETLDPMRRDYRGRETECVKEIVDGDKYDISKIDIVLVNYDKPSVGTSMEILYAWERDKLVYIVAKDRTPLSPWLRYHSHKIFTSFDDAFLWINKQVQTLHHNDYCCP